MSTATALGLQVARRVNDPNQTEIIAAGYLDYINMALQDLDLAGWVQPQFEDVTSISFISTVYDYPVPAGFAYITRLSVVDASGNYPLSYEIPQHQWWIGPGTVAEAAPNFHFFPDAFDLNISGRACKIQGQSRFAGSVAGGATIVAGAEGFIRERAVAYAAEQLSMGSDEQAIRRGRIADSAWAKSQQMLGNHPMQFRVLPSSRAVPGR